METKKLRLLHEHIANQRRDFIHKESRRIANAWDAVCLRDTDLTERARKLRGGNVLDAGFGLFRDCLRYKLERQGKAYIVLDPYTPTAKTCHACGAVHEALPPRARRWTCPHCGADLSREINGARNIRDMGLAEFLKQKTEAA